MNTIEFVGEHATTFEVHWHSHPQWELIYCTRGEGRFEFQNGMILPYSAGDTVVIPPQEIHCNHSTNGFTNIHIRLSDPSFPYKSTFTVRDDPDHHLESTFQQVMFYFHTDITGRDLILSALGDLVAGYMAAFHSNSEFSEPVELVRTQIQRNYSDPEFALDAYIHQLPFHYDYVRKLFKKEVGFTPLEYMTRLRMNKAATILSFQSEGDYSISETAITCGFDNPLYFSRVFRKHYGMPPSAYVNEHRRDSGA